MFFNKKNKVNIFFKKSLATFAIGVVLMPITACDVWKKSLDKKTTIKKSIDNKKNIFEKTQQNKIPNIIVSRPDYISLGIQGISGSATMTTPPLSTNEYRVVINKKDKIANKDKITIEYFNANLKGTINGQDSVVFSYVVQGLQEPQGKTNYKILKPQITITGENGKGTFAIPTFNSNLDVSTTAQIGNLSSGDVFSITVKGKNTTAMLYTINGKNQETWTYTVPKLKEPIIDLTIQQPIIKYSGYEGYATFNLPIITNVTLTTSAKQGHLSNNDNFTITAIADNGYTINGQKQVIWNYSVSGLTTKPKPAPNANIKLKKQGYDFNDIKVEEVTEKNGQKTIIGYFGKDYKESPVVFTSGYSDLELENKPNGSIPFIKKNEMEKFIKMYFQYIVHGPEFPTVGLISIDNNSFVMPKTGGWALDNGLSVRRNDVTYAPKNKSKALITINTKQVTHALKSYGHKIDYNNLDNKFAALYETFQHEYGHTVNYAQAIQAPSFIGREKDPKGFALAGIENGYPNSKNGQKHMPSAWYLSKKLLEALANAIGVDTTLPNMQTTVLTTLLSKKQELIKNGQSTIDVDKELSLLLFRLLVGTRDSRTGKLAGLMDRNKVSLWPNYTAPDKFEVEYWWPTTSGAVPNSAINGYSSGFHEMMTRLLVLITTKNNWWNNPETFSSLISGFNPFYKYNPDAFNFSDKDDGGLTGNEYIKNASNATLTIKSAVGKNSVIEKRNISKTTYAGGMLNPQIKEIKDMLIHNLDVNKRDKLVNFYKDTMFGYGKAISVFQKIDKNNAQFKDRDYPDDKYTMNLFGGWTKTQHQYLIFNNSNNISQVPNSTSIAFPIESAHSTMSFRNKGDENYKTRSNTLNTYKDWYVDWSDSLKNTSDVLSKELKDKVMYFWDDKNNDSVVETGEITTIPWTNARVLYDQAEKIYSGGHKSQMMRSNQSWKNLGEVLSSSAFDIYQYYVLSKTNNGLIKMEHDAP